MNFLSPETNCPLCEQPGQLIEEGLIERPDRNYFLCIPCEMAWQHPLPTQAEILAYYQGAYRHESSYFAYPDPSTYYARKLGATRLRWQQLKEYFGSGQQVIEIGCGTGGFLEQLVHAGCSAFGLEPYAPYAEYARQFAPVKEAYLETVAFPQPYDSFCLFHLLEHLRHPDQMLEKLRASSMEGSRLFIEVPNLQDAFNTGYIFPKALKRFVSPHLWTFAPKSLTQVVEAAGWTVTRMIPYQRTSLFTHVLHAIESGTSLIAQQQSGSRGPQAPTKLHLTARMEAIYQNLDFNYRRMLVEHSMADTLLCVAVNA